MDGPRVSPYVYSSTDHQGKIIRITVNFDNTTRGLIGSVVFRDLACVYRRIYLGRGADGTPNSTDKVFSVPAGTTNITAIQMAGFGLNVIEDVFALQITAGP